MQPLEELGRLEASQNQHRQYIVPEIFPVSSCLQRIEINTSVMKELVEYENHLLNSFVKNPTPFGPGSLHRLYDLILWHRYRR